MSASPVVSNSSPLIALAQIGHLGLLESLFGQVIVPPAVVRETAPSIVVPPWIAERPLLQAMGPRILRASLGPGESESLSLALEINAARIILDDRPARRLAEALGLPVVGTLGILLAAKRRGLVPALRPLLEALAAHDFRMAPDLQRQFLRDAGEQV